MKGSRWQKVDSKRENRSRETEEEYTCDTLLLSCGLIPENEISRGMGVDMNPVTSGPKVNEKSRDEYRRRIRLWKCTACT